MQDLLDFLSKRIKEAPNPQARMQYRRDMIKAIINSYPPEAPITMRELAAATGFQPRSSAIYEVIRAMVDDGEIKAINKGGATTPRSYVVLRPGNTYDEERGIKRIENYLSEKSVGALSEKSVGAAPKKSAYSFTELETIAIRWRFYNPTGRLEVFLKYLQEL